jgi:hypothetical protein
MVAKDECGQGWAVSPEVRDPVRKISKRLVFSTQPSGITTQATRLQDGVFHAAFWYHNTSFKTTRWCFPRSLLVSQHKLQDYKRASKTPEPCGRTIYATFKTARAKLHMRRGCMCSREVMHTKPALHGRSDERMQATILPKKLTVDCGEVCLRVCV